MQHLSPAPRILVVDDNRAIHEDFRKILCHSHSAAELAAAEAALFGVPAEVSRALKFRIDSAYQGKDALQMVESAKDQNDPYEMAFMDVRMPPGWDGIETTAAIWKTYPDLQVVVCTAYSDYSWDELHAKLGQTDKLVILKKPFDNIEVLQLAHAMTEKWRLLQQARVRVEDLERMVSTRTSELQETNRSLAAEVQERKAVEKALRESQELLLRQERLAVVGQLAAGVAHDFNNIMTIVQGHAGLLQATEQISAPGVSSLNEISSAASRASRLTQQLLAFSRKQVIRPNEVDLVHFASQFSATLTRNLGDRISLQLDCAPNTPRVWADSRQLEQVLLHLISNARDAMPDGGTVRIIVEPIVIGNNDTTRSQDGRAGRFVCLSVRDSGCGIDPEVLPKIFEPFFTTKDVGSGSGLGLSTVYGIVKQHEGWVAVDSEPGKGSEFRVYLPQTALAEQSLALSADTNAAARGRLANHSR